MDKRKENEIELLQTLVNRKGMQNILDTASRSLENPLFVCDLGYQIICRSDRGACCDEFWENVRHHSYGFPEQIGQIIRSGGFAEIGASDEPHFCTTACLPLIKSPTTRFFPICWQAL